MSKNRKRNGGMKRAYLKKTVHRYDTSPGVGLKYGENQQQHNLKDAIGLGRNINPIDALPHRARLWLDKNKHTPTITEPMAERVESWRITVKEDKKEWTATWATSSLSTIKVHYNGFNDRAIYRFTEINHLTGTTRESFTMTRDAAMRIKDNKLKGIVWK